MTRTIDPAKPIFMILPYRLMDCWVFDDEERGLYQEPFVGTTNEILDRMVSAKRIKNGTKKFRLFFSEGKFPKFQYALVWSRMENGGNVYLSSFGLEGWLCPALFKYFDSAPKILYVRVAKK